MSVKEHSDERPPPLHSKTILLFDSKRNLTEQPTSTSSLADVIYENIALEIDDDDEVNEINKHLVHLNTASNSSVTYSTQPDNARSSFTPLDETRKSSSLQNVKNHSSENSTSGKLNQISTNGEINNENHNVDRKRPISEENSKIGDIREHTRCVKINDFPRRESSVFLLSNNIELTTLPDSVRNSQLLGTSVSGSLSEASGASSSSITIKSLNGKMLLSPEEIWLETLESKLVVVTEGKPTLTLAKFKEALQVKESFFVDRCFQIFDTDGDGEVSLRLLVGELRSLVFGSQTDKIRFLFNVYNIQGTGKIVKSEIHQVLKSCVEESRLHFSSDDLQALTDAFLSGADRNKDGAISFEELRDLVERHPNIAENLAIIIMIVCFIFSHSTLLSGTQTTLDYDPVDEFMQETPFKQQRCCRHISKTYIQNNLQKISFLVFYLLINAGLGAVNGWRYWHLNVWLIVARVCGLCLDFNCTFVAVLMLRRLITSLRATPLVKILPFDQHIMFHKICGYTIAVQSIIHSIAHVGNAFIVSDKLQLSVPEVVFTLKANIGWVHGTAPVTGIALCLILAVMVALSMPFIRRRRCFEAFYWSHKLYLILWALLIIHAKDFWKWFVVPGLVFFLEAVSRISWVRSAYMGRTYIESVCLLPSEVTQLVITRPAGFAFRPGDYLYVQIPAIARYEWHPFTISSAPEQRDTLWLHIRTAGYWTKSLHDFFTSYVYEDVEAGMEHSETYETLKKCNLRRRASSIAWAKRKPLKARKIESRMRERVVTKRAKVLCHIDGPYGTPSRRIFDSEHAVLVGSGIGITPFASILQSIVNQFKSGCVSCPKCRYTWCHTLPATVMNLKKVDFILINRDQRHFEWFVSLLSRLEREQEIDGGLGHVLDMQMYMTSALPKSDMKGLGLQLALDLVHENERTDLITGLQTRTQTGRPDFDVLFRKIQSKAKGNVTVFFCGSPLLGKTLKNYSHKYGFAFRHENF